MATLRTYSQFRNLSEVEFIRNAYLSDFQNLEILDPDSNEDVDSKLKHELPGLNRLAE